VYAETVDTPIPVMGCSFLFALGREVKSAPHRSMWRGGQDGHSEMP
jgi:hypothetical protein